MFSSTNNLGTESVGKDEFSSGREWVRKGEKEGEIERDGQAERQTDIQTDRMRKRARERGGGGGEVIQ